MLFRRPPSWVQRLRCSRARRPLAPSRSLPESDAYSPHLFLRHIGRGLPFISGPGEPQLNRRLKKGDETGFVAEFDRFLTEPELRPVRDTFSRELHSL